MSKPKLRRWDVTEALKSDEDMVLYLQACMDEAGDAEHGDSQAESTHLARPIDGDGVGE